MSDHSLMTINKTDNIVSPVSKEEDRDENKTCSVGRRGDPRMHAAVAARLKNPNMSLLDALLIGGFKFDKTSNGGASDRSVYDSDGVLLRQRKNQLSRRLRLAKRNLPSTKMTKSPLIPNTRGPAKKRPYSDHIGLDGDFVPAIRPRLSEVDKSNQNNVTSNQDVSQTVLLALLQEQRRHQLLVELQSVQNAISNNSYADQLFRSQHQLNIGLNTNPTLLNQYMLSPQSTKNVEQTSLQSTLQQVSMLSTLNQTSPAERMARLGQAIDLLNAEKRALIQRCIATSNVGLQNFIP